MEEFLSKSNYDVLKGEISVVPPPFQASFYRVFKNSFSAILILSQGVVKDFFVACRFE
jgi:hypothetical protein